MQSSDTDFLDESAISAETSPSPESTDSEILTVHAFSINAFRDLFDTGQIERAIELLCSAVLVCQPDIEPLQLAVEHLFFAQALDNFRSRLQERSVGLHPSARQHYRLVLLLINFLTTGSDLQVESQVQELARDGLDETDVRIRLASSAARCRDYARATAQYRAALAAGASAQLKLSLAAAVYLDRHFEEANRLFGEVAVANLETIPSQFVPTNWDRNSVGVPSHWHGRFQQCLQLVVDKRYKDALLLFATGLSDPAPPLPFLYNIGLCYFQLGHFDDCIRFLIRVRAQSPRYPSIQWNLAVAHYHSGSLEEARDAIQSVLAVNREDKRCLSAAIYLERQLGNSARAADLAQELSRSNAGNLPESQALAAHLLWQVHRTTEAETIYDNLAFQLFGQRRLSKQESSPSPIRAESPPPPSIAAKSTGLPTTVQPPFSMAEMRSLFQNGMVDRAINYFLDSVRRDVVPFEKLRDAIRFLYQKRGIDRLAAQVTTVQTEVPKTQAILDLLGLAAFIYTSEHPAALGVDVLASMEAQGLPAAHVQTTLGCAFAARGQFELALTHLRSAAQLSPDEETLVNLAAAEFASGDKQHASEYFEAAFDRIVERYDKALAPTNLNRNQDQLPANTRSNFLRALTLFDRGEIDAAYDCFLSGYLKTPSCFPFLVNQGICLITLQRFDDAVKPLNRALQQAPRDALVLWNLIVALIRSETFDDAKRLLDEYLSLATNKRSLVTAALLHFRSSEDSATAEKYCRRLIQQFIPDVDARVVAGYLLHRLGNEEAAVEQFEQLGRYLFQFGESDTLSVPGPAKLDPSKRIYDGEELARICRELCAQGEAERALSFLRTYSDRNPSYVPSVLQMARVLEYLDKPLDAQRCHEKAIGLSSDRYRAIPMIHFGQFCIRQNRLVEGKTLIDKALQLSPPPQWLSSLQQLSRRLEVLGTEHALAANKLEERYVDFVDSRDHSSGIEFFVDVAKSLRDDPLPLVHAGRLAAIAGRLSEAIAYYEDAITLTRDWVRRSQWLVELSRVYIRHGSKLEAVRCFWTASDVDTSVSPVRSDAKDLIATTVQIPSIAELNKYWNEVRQTGQFDAALRLFQSYLQHDPNNPVLWRLIGFAYQNIEKDEEAYDALLKVAHLTDSIQAWLRLGYFSFRLGMYERAEEAYKVALQKDPVNSWALQTLGKISAARKTGGLEWRDSRIPTKELLQTAWLRFHRARVYQQAIDYFRQITLDHPDLAAAHQFLGWAYGMAALVTEGLKSMWAMCEAAQDDEHYMICAAYCEQRGFPDDAIKAYDLALAKNPFNSSARNSLRKFRPADAPYPPITGAAHAEGWAQTLCRHPNLKEFAARLHTHFVSTNALSQAEVTLAILLRMHPGNPNLLTLLNRIREDLGGGVSETSASSAELRSKLPVEPSMAPAPFLGGAWGTRRLLELAPNLLEGLPLAEIEASAIGEEALLRTLDERLELARTGSDVLKCMNHCMFSLAVALRMRDGQRVAETALLYAQLRSQAERDQATCDHCRRAKCIAEAFYLAACTTDPSLHLRLIQELFFEGFLEALDRADAVEDISRLEPCLTQAHDACVRVPGANPLVQVTRRLRDVASLIKDYSSNKTWDALTTASRKLLDLSNYAENELPEQESWITTLTDDWQRLIGPSLGTGAELSITFPPINGKPEDSVLNLVLQIQNKSGIAAANVFLRASCSTCEVSSAEQLVNVIPGGAIETRVMQISPGSGCDGVFEVRVACQYDDFRAGRMQLEFGTVVGFAGSAAEPRENPYHPGPALDPGSNMFFGRKNVISAIEERLIHSTDAKGLFTLYGTRRTGKTSVLQRLKAISTPFVPVLITCPRLSSLDTAHTMSSIADEISVAVKRSGAAPSVIAEETFAAAPTHAFDRYLRALMPILGERRLLLMFDEFEIIVENAAQGKIDPNILLYLRDLMQFEPALSFVLSGGEKLRKYMADYGSILFNLTTNLRIGFLDDQAARELVEVPTARIAIRCRPSAVDLLVGLTVGQPYFLQLLGSHVLDHLKRDNCRAVLTAVDVEAVANLLVTDGDSVAFAFLWQPPYNTSSDRLVMAVLAEHMENDTNWVSETVLVEKCREANPAVEEPVVLQSLDSLEQRQIVGRRIDLPRRLYRIQMPLHRWWLRVHHPVGRTVREEIREQPFL